jgi:hypothetical protein
MVYSYQEGNEVKRMVTTATPAVLPGGLAAFGRSDTPSIDCHRAMSAPVNNAKS